MKTNQIISPMKKGLPQSVSSDIEDLLAFILVPKNVNEIYKTNENLTDDFDFEKLYLKLKNIFGKFCKYRHSHLINKLTEREIEIIILICEGKTTNELAKTLYISRHTIESHLPRIYSKLNLRNSKELIAFGFRAGLKF